MIKKTISFALIFLLLLIIYQYLVNMIKSNHTITYTVDNGELFYVDERYINEEGNDYYLLKITTEDDKKFVFDLDNIFNKQKIIVKDIESFEQDGYYCIGLKLAGYGNYSYPECYKNNVIYSYSSIKNQVDFKGYLEKINDPEVERFSNNSKKNDDIGITVNKDYLDKNEILMVYNYKQISLHYPTYSRSFSFSTMDNYKNEYGTLVGNYYVIFKTTSLPTIKTFVKYDVIDGIKNEISLPIEMSKQIYVNGIHDNKLYVFDKSNKRQFEINPKTDEVNIVGTTEQEGVNFVNGEKQPISVYDLDASNVVFTEGKEAYSSIDSDFMYVNGKYAVYAKNGYVYKVYKEFIDDPVFLFYEAEAKELKAKGNNIYYIKDDTIYKHNTYGSYPLAIKNELKYNYENMYDVYLK